MTDAERGGDRRARNRWRTRRIWIACASGAGIALISRLLDFWPLETGLSGGLRELLWLGQLCATPPIAVFAATLLVAAIIALARCHLRAMASSLLAIAMIPGGFRAVLKLPVFDPWLWYAIANRSTLDRLARERSGSTEPEFAILETEDVPAGIVGNNHFIALIYDRSDERSVDPFRRSAIWSERAMFPGDPTTPMPRGTRLIGHIDRVDEWE